MENVGTKIIATIRPATTEDSFPVAYANELQGGYMQINTLTNIDIEIPLERRVEGMMIYCKDTKQRYQLQQDLTSWDLLKESVIVLDATGQYLIIDGSGKIAFRISPSGMVDFAGFGNIFKYELNRFLRIEGYANVSSEIEKLADINHIITYGQSLAVGQSDRIITDIPFSPNAVMFASGGLTNPLYFSHPVDYSSLTPLMEQTPDLQPAINESPVSGTAEYMINNLSNTINYNKLILSSNPSQGALTIAQLSKGTDSYNRLINDIIGGFVLATNLNKTYKVLAVTFSQGEQDYINANSYAVYKADLIKLKNSINTDVKEITGQVEDVKFIIYQTSTINDLADTPEIAYAQFDAAIEEENIYMATPTYHFQYNDNYHLKAEYSKLLGMYYGRTLYNIITKGYFKPLHIVNHIIKDNVVYLFFHLPEDTDLRLINPHSLNIPNNGFSILNDEQEEIIVSVETVANSKRRLQSLKITCKESIPSGSLLYYGNAKYNIPNTKVNAGGLCCDSSNEIQIDGTAYYLNYWCPIFKYQL